MSPNNNDSVNKGTEDLFSSLLYPCHLKSLMSDATPSATQFFKRPYKISNNPGLQASLDALPSFAAWSKYMSPHNSDSVNKGTEDFYFQARYPLPHCQL